MMRLVISSCDSPRNWSKSLSWWPRNFSKQYVYEFLVDCDFIEFMKLKYALLCTSNTCITFMLGTLFLELTLFIKPVLRMI